MDSGSGGDGQGGIDCGATPSLAALDAGGDGGPVELFCTTTSAGAFDCPYGDVCCLGASAPAECAQLGSPCLNGTGDAGPQAAAGVVCNGVGDCIAQGITGATACCLQGAQAIAGCAFPLLSGGNSVVCEGPGDGGADAGAGAGDGGVTACKAGETQVCTTSADCPGKTCVAASWHGRPIGTCQ